MRERTLWSFTAKDGERARIVLQTGDETAVRLEKLQEDEPETCDCCGQTTKRNKYWVTLGEVEPRDGTIIPREFR